MRGFRDEIELVTGLTSSEADLKSAGRQVKVSPQLALEVALRLGSLKGSGLGRILSYYLRLIMVLPESLDLIY
jgi:hypothetical protein